MSESSFALNLSVIAIHKDTASNDRVSLLTAGIAAVVKRVETRLRASFPNVILQPRVISSSQAPAMLDGCVAAVVDAVDVDTQLAFVSGSLHGAGIPCLVVYRKDAQTSWRDVTDQSTVLIPHETLDEMWQADSLLEEQLVLRIPQSRIHEELVYRFWFPRETTAIWVVCPQIHEPGEYADRSSPDYTYLDNLGDTDALLELMVFLSQYYPKATIEQFSADDLPDGHTSGNLVVIGGPGSTEISNEVCRGLMSAIDSRVSYSHDCEMMNVVREGAAAAELRAEYGVRKSGEKPFALAPRKGIIATLTTLFVKQQPAKELAKDWGYFARFRNPLNENATVVLANGLHTAGVVGAARAFSDRRETLRNYHTVFESGVDVSEFECVFPVLVLNGEPKVPAVAAANILQLGPGAAALPIVPQRSPAERRSTTRVLFIAGDRGGARINQVQIPNEYHAIQEALHSSKHRDVIELTQPILAATRIRLAGAYRERPTVLHFAGHGNDRHLAIIEDQGVIAHAIALDVDQLCAMTKTMEQRVRLCVLSACQSADLAREMAEKDVVDFAIGWPGNVQDSSAIAFSAALYGAIGDGRTLGDSVDTGKVACGVTDTPVLFAAPGRSNSTVLIDTGAAA